MRQNLRSISPLPLKKVDLSQPPRAFEEFNRVSGIAGQYIYPNNMSVHQFEQQLRQDHLDIWDYYKCTDHVLVLSKPFPEQKLKDLQTLLADLTVLNPTLSTIPFDENNPQEIFDVLFGAASSINENDIAFFLEHRNENAPSQASALQDKDYKALFNAINAHSQTKVKIAWVPSKETLMLINRQIQARIPKLRP